MLQLQHASQPARLVVASDMGGQSLLQRVQSLTDKQRTLLLFRCNVSRPEDMHWFTSCCATSDCARLNYAWQAEFRATHVWFHPALAEYKYMLWLDSDAFCMQPWMQDPIDVMVRNRLVLFFDHFPQGHSSSRLTQLLKSIVRRVFNSSLCGNITMNHLGQLHMRTTAPTCADNAVARIPLLHGFFHVTDLGFFRSPAVSAWVRNLTEDTKFSRHLDDQLAVTVPAAILAPGLAWDMRSNGVKLNVFHNGAIDGHHHERVGGFKRWFSKHGKGNFSAGWKACRITDAV